MKPKTVPNDIAEQFPLYKGKDAGRIAVKAVSLMAVAENGDRIWRMPDGTIVRTR